MARNPFVTKKKAAEAEPVSQVSTTPALDGALRKQDPFDDIAEGRDVTSGSTPNAVTDNNAEDTSFGLAGEVGLGRKGKSIEVDDGVDSDVKAKPASRGDAFGIDVSGGAQGGSQAGGGGGNPAADGVSGGSGSGSQAGLDILQGELESAKGNQKDVATDLLGTPDIGQGAGNQGSGQRLFDLQTQSADLALANASAVETEPSFAEGQAGEAVKNVLEIGAGAAGAIGGGSAAGGVGAAGIGVGAASAATVAGVVGAGLVPGVTILIADELTDGHGALITAVGAGAINAPLIIAGAAVAAAAGAVGDAIHAAEEEEAFQASLENLKNRALLEKQQEEEAKAKKEQEEAEKKKKEEEEAERKRQEEEAKKKEEEEAKARGGGAESTPDEDRITREEFLLGQQIKEELGFRRIAGDIDFGEGDGTNSGTGSPDNLTGVDAIFFDKVGLIGQPGEENATAPPPDLGQTAPPIGPDGTEVQVEDGNPFTGGTRSEDDPNFNVGTAPLVGFNTNDDEEEEDDDDSSTSIFAGIGSLSDKTADDDD